MHSDVGIDADARIGLGAFLQATRPRTELHPSIIYATRDAAEVAGLVARLYTPCADRLLPSVFGHDGGPVGNCADAAMHLLADLQRGGLDAGLALVRRDGVLHVLVVAEGVALDASCQRFTACRMAELADDVLHRSDFIGMLGVCELFPLEPWSLEQWRRMAEIGTDAQARAFALSGNRVQRSQATVACRVEVVASQIDLKTDARIRA
jgi:hypothetical protein